MKGSSHYAWRGDAARDETKRMRAQKLYPSLGMCERCHSKSAIDRHHINGNTGDNDRKNVAFLCRRCHMAEDGRLMVFRNLAYLNHQRNRLPPRICTNCENPSEIIRHGRCHACSVYLWRHGNERPVGDITACPEGHQILIKRVRADQTGRSACDVCRRKYHAAKQREYRQNATRAVVELIEGRL